LIQRNTRASAGPTVPERAMLAHTANRVRPATM
jgi:hypothetical protein